MVLPKVIDKKDVRVYHQYINQTDYTISYTSINGKVVDVEIEINKIDDKKILYFPINDFIQFIELLGISLDDSKK